MNIAEQTLADQFRRAKATWPFVDEIEQQHGLPSCLLYAVGSRETNLGVVYTQGKTGDSGHGHGVWQLDDRFHTIPAGFDTNPKAQADTAASILRILIDHFDGDVNAALCAYNAGARAVEKAIRAGRDPNRATTGHDYGVDVLGRMRYLQSIADAGPSPTPLPPIEEDEMFPRIATDPANGDFWVLTGPNGAVDAYKSTGEKSDRYYGNFLDHPDFHAGENQPLGPAVDIDFWPQGQPVEGQLPGGYVLYSRAPDGSIHPYHFDARTLTAPA